jgi:hypothetical protein
MTDCTELRRARVDNGLDSEGQEGMPEVSAE